VHNVAEARYGTKAWDVRFPRHPPLPFTDPDTRVQCYYSALPGHDGLTWADAHLTPLGEQQARAVNALWKRELNAGLPVPDVFYVSPLTRTIQTADLSFAALDTAYRPYVVELLREALGIHTCDARSPASHLRAAYPHLTFEPGFSDQDVLWQKDYREPNSARRYRLATLLDDVWERPGTWVSATSHSGAIASVLEVLGHRKWDLETGGVVPVVVRAERVERKRSVPAWEPSDSGEMCTEPPPGLL
jgi:broad specificity phosphatase PhoE